MEHHRRLVGFLERRKQGVADQVAVAEHEPNRSGYSCRELVKGRHQELEGAIVVAPT